MEPVRRLALCAAALFACGRSEGERGEVFKQGDLTITNVVAPAPLTGTVSVYFAVANADSVADTLAAITTPIASMAMAHDQVTHGGMTAMRPLPYVVIPALGSARFAPGGRHVMLEGLTRRIVAGDTIPLVLSFSHGGRVSIRARVVSYAQLDSALR